MRFAILVFLTSLLMGFSSCGTKNRVTDGDRMLSDQNKKAAGVIVKAVDKAEAVSGVQPEVLDALGPVKPAATDIKANAETQLKVWGPPEKPVPYSAAVSASSRKQTEEEHESSPIWPIAIGIGTTALGIFLRSTGLGGIPFLGPILARMSPRLAHGAGKADLMNVGFQEALTELRTELDKREPELRAAMIDKGIPLSLVDKIPTGAVIIEKVTKIMTRRGLIKENDQLLEKARRDAVGTLDVTKLSVVSQATVAAPPAPEAPDESGEA